MAWEPLFYNFFLFWGVRKGGGFHRKNNKRVSERMQRVTEEEGTRLGLVFKGDRYMTKKQSSDNACGNAYLVNTFLTLHIFN